MFTLAFFVQFLALTAAGIGLLFALGFDPAVGSRTQYVILGFAGLVSALNAGWICGRFLEFLPLRALGASFSPGWISHFLSGSAIGALTLALAVVVGMIGGGLRFTFDATLDTKSLAYSLAGSFVVFAAMAAFEEALCRGYFLQTFSRSGLVWIGIAITSLYFGAGHLNNPNANAIAIANTVLAGIWFSVAYLKTRDLWLVWGMHLMWNWVQGSIFGIEVSGLTGITSTPLLKEVDSGPSWLTGSTYGIEGGVVCTIAMIVSTAAIYFLPIAKPDPELLVMSSSPAEVVDPTPNR